MKRKLDMGRKLDTGYVALAPEVKVLQIVFVLLFLLTLSLAQVAFSEPLTADSTLQNPAASVNSSLQVGASSQKIPAGTYLSIAFNTPMDSLKSQAGDIFNAALTEDFIVSSSQGRTRVVLPTGTLVRGRIDSIKRPSFFSKGGSIFLAFDHVVLPSGELLPLALNLSTENTQVNKEGALYSDPGIGKKVQSDLQEGKQTFTAITQKGIEAGKHMANGYGGIVTVPLSVVGGAVATTAITTGKAAVSVVGKGESMVIKPGDTVTIDFGGSFNLPAE